MLGDRFLTKADFWKLVATGTLSVAISLTAIITYAETRVVTMIAEKSPYAPDKKAIETVLKLQQDQLKELTIKLETITRSVDKLTATIEAKLK